jgi:transcriptional regulator with XRE-family HTH domain
MKLKELIEKHELQQKEIAIELGFKQSIFNMYVNEIRNPPIKALIKIANFFKVSVDYLIENSTENKCPDITPKEFKLLSLFRDMSKDNQDLLIKNAEAFTNSNEHPNGTTAQAL